jgi:hypothetical protein
VARGGGADGVEGGVSGRHVDGALSVLLALTDASGSTLRVEHDAGDGRTYLTVGFDGHEAPFELGRSTAVQVAGALRGLLNDRRIGGDGGGADPAGTVKQGNASRETGSR